MQTLFRLLYTIQDTIEWAGKATTPGATVVRLGSSIGSIAVSDDGERFVVGLNSGRVYVFDGKGRIQGDFVAHDGRVNGLSMNADGTRFASGGMDGRLRLWQTNTGILEMSTKQDWGDINAVALHPKGSTVAFGTTMQGFGLWVEGAGVVAVPESIHEHNTTCVAFPRTDNPWTAVSGTFYSSVAAWDVNGRNKCADLGDMHSLQTAAVAVHPTTGAIFSAGLDGTILVSVPVEKDGHTNLPVNYVKERILVNGDSVSAMALSDDGSMLAAGGAGYDNEVRVYNTRNGRLLLQIQGHIRPVTALAWSSKNVLMTGSHDGTVRIYDLDYHLTDE